MGSNYKKFTIEQDLVTMSLEFQRDFYLRTREDMAKRWIIDVRRDWVLSEIYPGLPAKMRRAVDSAFEGHLPFWEYTKHIIYAAKEFDPISKKMVSIADFRLQESLHKDILCTRIENYITSGQKEPRNGLAIFITRMGLKTYVGCIALASWLLTRHRIIWGDYTTIRIIHDVEDEAIRRAAIIKGFHLRSRRLRELYPEVCLPQGGRWMSDGAWNLAGREEGADKEDIDFQISAKGIRASMQGRHPMYTILDDLESERHSESEATVKETKNFFTGTAFSEQIGLSKNILLGTFYNPASIHATIAENAEAAERGELDPEGTWEIIWLPAILDEGKAEERPLYPLRLGIDVLKQKEKQIETSTGSNLKYRMQCMLDFKASADVTFDMRMWQEVDLMRPETEADLKIEAALSGAPCLVQCDFAGKDSSTAGRGDYNAVWVVKYPVMEGQVHRVILDGFMDNTRTLDEACGKALNLAVMYDAWWIVPEESLSHKVVGSTMNRIAAERGQSYFMVLDSAGKATGNIIPLVPRAQNTRGMGTISSWKMARMLKFQHVFNAGQVWFNKNLDYTLTEGLKNQLGPFPFIKKDDLVDAISMADDEKMAVRIPNPRIRATPVQRFARAAKKPAQRRMKYTGFAV